MLFLANETQFDKTFPGDEPRHLGAQSKATHVTEKNGLRNVVLLPQLDMANRSRSPLRPRGSFMSYNKSIDFALSIISQKWALKCRGL
jgi:hypothetical protein